MTVRGLAYDELENGVAFPYVARWPTCYHRRSHRKHPKPPRSR